MEDNKITPEQAERIRMGELARKFLESIEWKELVNPILTSMITGVTDIRNLKSADISSDTKARVEVLARKMVADYLTEISVLIEGFITDSDAVMAMLNKKENRQNVYKRV